MYYIGRALDKQRGNFIILLSLFKLRIIYILYISKRIMGAKIHNQKGKSPD